MGSILEEFVMERSYNVEDEPSSLFFSGNGPIVKNGISISQQMPDLGAASDNLQPCHVRVKLRLDFCRTGCGSQGAALGRACLRK